MSLKKSITHRLSLFAGSSLAVAGLSAAASIGASLVPAAALAQTATCLPAPTSGNGTAAVVYAAGTYNPGIDCDYTGTGATVSTGGAVTVSNQAGGTGIDLDATGAATITWDSTLGATANDAQVTGGNFTNGAVIRATSGSGAITIRTDNVSGSANSGTAATNSTHGVWATSTSGAITIQGQTISGGGTSGGAAAPGVAGIQASSSGAVSISVANASGRLHGILAETTGSGALTINVTGQASGSTRGISAKTGAGLMTINASQATLFADVGAGGAEITLGFANGSTTVPAVDLLVAVGGTTRLTHTSTLGTSSGFGQVDGFLIRAAGSGNIEVTSTGQAKGFVNLSTHTGNLTWAINNGWATKGTSFFGSGNDTLTLAAGAEWLAGVPSLNAGGDGVGSQGTLEAATVFNFGGGDDRVVNNGILMLNPKSYGGNNFGRNFQLDYLEAEVRFEGLETFQNAGTIYFGGIGLPPEFGGPTDRPLETDQTNDDVMVLPGTHWVGSPGSRLILDAFVNKNQTACDPALRNMAVEQITNFSNGIPVVSNVFTGEMPAADCLRLEGGSTEGETTIVLNQLSEGDRGGALRIVLVDVEGGDSAAGHFVLDPGNLGYNADQGGYLDLGYFILPLVYDADSQQHALIGTAGQNAWQTTTWATAAHDIWRTSTGSWFDRQADLRGDLAEGVGGGIWLRTSAGLAEREVMHVQTAGTTTFDFDNSYEQNTYAVTGGVDVMTGGGGDTAWIVGLMAGYANSEITFDASPNTTQFDSWNGGLYASVLSGGLYVDAVVSGNKADVKADMPALNLFPTGTLVDTRLLTVGAQVEAGWRFAFAEGAFIEPLGGVSWVRTKWDDLPVPSADPLREGVIVEFDDPTSLRANVGARVGFDQDFGAMRAQYSALGRVWNEFEGEHDLTLYNIAEDVFVSDEFTGTMTELGFGASVYGSVVSGFLNVGGKWADDYQSVGGTAGVRVAW